LGALGGGGVTGRLGRYRWQACTRHHRSQPQSEEDAARVMNYARRERPELLSKTVEEKPWF